MSVSLNIWKWQLNIAYAIPVLWFLKMQNIIDVSEFFMQHHFFFQYIFFSLIMPCLCIIFMSIWMTLSLSWQMATQNLSGNSHPGTELQYLPYPLQSRHYIPYQPSQVNTQLSAPRSSTQFSRTDPFIHVSSIVVPGIQGTQHPSLTLDPNLMINTCHKEILEREMIVLHGRKWKEKKRKWKNFIVQWCKVYNC